MSEIFSLFYHPLYSDGLDRTARFPVDRYRLLSEKISRLDVENKIHIKEPRLAKKEEILRVHQEDFVDRFLNGKLSDREVRRIGLKPWKKEIIDRTLRLTGGALEALDEVLVHGNKMAGNMAGGTHHAFREAGAGYCIFNDLAVCAEQALLNLNVEKILILDLDVHQGDGTAKIFGDDERVYTVSLHGKNNFPFRKQKSDWDVEFDNKTEDSEYLKVLHDVLSKLSNMNFDLIFFQAGVDGLASDALGLLNLSREGLMERNKRVFAFREKIDLPMVIFMGGGYAKPIEDTVDSFTDLFMEAANRI